MSPSEILVSGHSLGGATATLLADAIRQQSGRKNVKLYTFGAPGAGVEGHSCYLVYDELLHNDNDWIAVSTRGHWTCLLGRRTCHASGSNSVRRR